MKQHHHISCWWQHRNHLFSALTLSFLFTDCHTSSLTEGRPTLRTRTRTCKQEWATAVLSQSRGREQCLGASRIGGWIWCCLQGSYTGFTRSKDSNPWIYGGGTIRGIFYWCGVVLTTECPLLESFVCLFVSCTIHLLWVEATCYLQRILGCRSSKLM